MRWLVRCGDILEEPADVLVCSANIYLNLSGGVGGEILRRYGTAMQEALHAILAQRNRRFLDRGNVVTVPPCGTAFKAVIHAIAVNGFYESSPSVVESVVRKSLEAAVEMKAPTVALTALATGFGRLSMTEFARGIAPLMSAEFPPIGDIAICVSRPDQVDELRTALPDVE